MELQNYQNIVVYLYSEAGQRQLLRGASMRHPKELKFFGVDEIH